MCSSDLPKGVKLGTDSGAFFTAYRSDGKANDPVVTQRYETLQQVDFGATDYPALRNYFGAVSTANGEQLVLRVGDSQ